MYNHHLDTFVCAAEKGSFSKAAEELYISPNAVMKQINLLEDHLGIPLFVRTNHGLTLTEAGELIYREARYLIRRSQETLAQARALAEKGGSVIRVGSSLLRPGQGVVELWKRVRESCPDIRLEIVPFDDQRDNYLEITAHLGKEIDLISGLFPSAKFDGRCSALELGRQPLCCAIAMGHPLAGKDRLRIEDLYGEKLIMARRGSTAYIDALRDEIEQNHREIEIVDVPDYDVGTWNLCASTDGIMITAGIWKEVHPSLVTLPVDWDYAVPYGLLYALHPSEQVERFIEAVRKLAIH